jgi:hypothetical protein
MNNKKGCPKMAIIALCHLLTAFYYENLQHDIFNQQEEK